MQIDTNRKQAYSNSSSNTKSRVFKFFGATAITCSFLLGMSAVGGSPAFAAEAKVDLGTSGAYSVLGGSTVTNTGPSILDTNLGVSPGTSITGFPPGTALGAIHAANAEAELAQSDLVIAYNDAASREVTETVGSDLVGRTLVGGVYKTDSALELSGNLTLDGEGTSDSVWVFQVGSTLTTSSSSNIDLINGATACNIFWQIGSSATLGTSSNFKGSILALESISVNTNATIEGRALARNGAVTLDSNVILDPACDETIDEPTETPTDIPTDVPTEIPVIAPTDAPPVDAPTDATSPGDSTNPGDTPSTPSDSIIPTDSVTPDDSIIPTDSKIPSRPGDSTIPADQIIIDESVSPTDSTVIVDENKKEGGLAKTGAESNMIIAGAGILLALIGGLLLRVGKGSRLRTH